MGEGKRYRRRSDQGSGLTGFLVGEEPYTGNQRKKMNQGSGGACYLLLIREELE